MHIDSFLIARWPKLAWHATWSRHGKVISVHHGANVEIRNDRIFEGVWDGDFKKGEFDRSSVFTGTGLVVRNEEVALIPPIDFTLGYIYVSPPNDFGEVHASNSLLCWLQQTGHQLHPAYADYYADFIRIAQQGASDTLPTLPLSGGAEVGVVYLAPLVAGPDADRRLPGNQGPVFEPNFSAYRQFLTTSLNRILQNACDPSRIAPLHPVVPISEGFDSTAVAALAKELGVKDSYTILGREDARQIGKRLNLNVVPKHRLGSLFFNTQTNLEFFAMPGGLNRTQALFESTHRNAFLLTGYGGDRIWCVEAQYKEGLSIPTLKSFGGLSSLEYRLRVGYQTLGIPLIGIWHHSIVNRIARDPEMATWMEPDQAKHKSRPFARRLGVEAGVPASLFGQKKVAGGIVFPTTFKGLWHLSFKRYLKRIPNPTATQLQPGEFPILHGSPYRWAMHWAHEKLKGRYEIRR